MDVLSQLLMLLMNFQLVLGCILVRFYHILLMVNLFTAFCPVNIESKPAGLKSSSGFGQNHTYCATVEIYIGPFLVHE